MQQVSMFDIGLLKFGRLYFKDHPADIHDPTSIPDLADSQCIPPVLYSGLPLLVTHGHICLPAPSTMKSLSKRAFDLVGASAGLILLAFPMLLIALTIRLRDGAPALYRQQRIGRDGQVFTILKYQTVRSGAVTPLGPWLRRTSVDELPQLINVLLGHMSLVGPRPYVPDMTVEGIAYESLSPHYALRHSMCPGLTGWAQANHLRGPLLNRAQALARLGHDLAYIQNHSLFLDFVIIWRTLRYEFVSGNAN
jgi:lipopolysaccharide/colanic/teichoic acid biosynthesis glycosyltransferase